MDDDTVTQLEPVVANDETPPGEGCLRHHGSDSESDEKHGYRREPGYSRSNARGSSCCSGEGRGGGDERDTQQRPHPPNPKHALVEAPLDSTGHTGKLPGPLHRNCRRSGRPGGSRAESRTPSGCYHARIRQGCTAVGIVTSAPDAPGSALGPAAHSAHTPSGEVSDGRALRL